MSNRADNSGGPSIPRISSRRLGCLGLGAGVGIRVSGVGVRVSGVGVGIGCRRLGSVLGCRSGWFSGALRGRHAPRVGGWKAVGPPRLGCIGFADCGSSFSGLCVGLVVYSSGSALVV